MNVEKRFQFYRGAATLTPLNGEAHLSAPTAPYPLFYREIKVVPRRRLRRRLSLTLMIPSFLFFEGNHGGSAKALRTMCRLSLSLPYRWSRNCSSNYNNYSRLHTALVFAYIELIYIDIYIKKYLYVVYITSVYITGYEPSIKRPHWPAPPLYGFPVAGSLPLPIYI